MRRSPLRTAGPGALLLAALVLANPAAGQARPAPGERLRAGWRQFWAERAIENGLVKGQLRGLLGRRPPPPDWTPRRSGQGRLERGPGGVPILYLEGTPEEMGRQHGALLRNEIQALQRYVEAFVGRRELPAARARARALFEEHCPPRYLREARALAEAAGMRSEDLLFAQWFTDLYRGFSCSTLAAPSSAGTFLARNLDFPTLGYLQRYSIVVVARPAGHEPYVSVSWPGLIGVLSGQNAGFALSVLVVLDAGGVQGGLPFQLAFRRLLEETPSADAAEALMRRLPITVTNNLMLVDRRGAPRVLELHPAGVVARRADARGRITATNHFLSPERRAPRLSFSFLSSARRLRAVHASCPPEAESLRLSQARAALRAAATSATAQSMVFLPARGEMEVAFSARTPAAEATWVRLPAERLLGE